MKRGKQPGSYALTPYQLPNVSEEEASRIEEEAYIPGMGEFSPYFQHDALEGQNEWLKWSRPFIDCRTFELWPKIEDSYKLKASPVFGYCGRCNYEREDLACFDFGRRENGELVPATAPNVWLDGDKLCPIYRDYFFFDEFPNQPFAKYADSYAFPNEGFFTYYYDLKDLKAAKLRGTLRGKYWTLCPSCGARLDASSEKLNPILLKLAGRGVKRVSIQALNRRLSRQPRKFKN